MSEGGAFYPLGGGGGGTNLLPLNNTWTGTNTFMQNVVIGTDPTATTPAITIGGTTATVNVQGTNYSVRLQTHKEGDANIVDLGMGAHSNTADTAPILYSLRSEGTEATKTVVTSGDTLFIQAALGYDGTTYQPSLLTEALVDGTVSSGIVPATINMYLLNSVTGILARYFLVDSKLNTVVGDIDDQSGGVNVNVNQLFGISLNTGNSLQTVTTTNVTIDDGSGNLSAVELNASNGLTATVPLAMLTVGGTQGSIDFVNGIAIGSTYVAPT